MTLKEWLDSGWLKPHTTSRGEIASLLSIVQRDLQDAARGGGISADWRFGIAYNAALKLCMILLYAEGYRPAQGLGHYRPLQALPLILGAGRKADAEYLDACRIKRNAVEYEYAGGATDADADELIEFSKSLEREVLDWLKARHADLAPR